MLQGKRSLIIHLRSIFDGFPVCWSEKDIRRQLPFAVSTQEHEVDCYYCEIFIGSKDVTSDL